MTLLAGLIVAGVLTACFRERLRRHPWVFYGIAVFCSVVIALENYHGFPAVVETYVVGLLGRGTFATALWCQVMWAGALPDHSKVRRTIIPIRGELSILAATLTLGHNFRYGKNYLVKLFLSPADLSFSQKLACTITLVMLLIMIPLTILSFKSVRRRLRPKTWKKIQRLAYLFYAGIYCHVMCLYLPKIAEGEDSYFRAAAIYTLLFGAYAVVRVRKWFFKWKLRATKTAAASAEGQAIRGKKRNSFLWNTGFLGIYILLTGGILFEAAVIRETAVQEADGQAENETSGNAAVSCKDGGYEVQVMGYDGYLNLTVTIEDEKITDITGSSEESDLWYFRTCSKTVMSAIIEAQDTHVDAVSECTTTSKAIMKGVRKALEAAQE